MHRQQQVICGCEIWMSTITCKLGVFTNANVDLLNMDEQLTEVFASRMKAGASCKAWTSESMACITSDLHGRNWLLDQEVAFIT